LVGGYERRADVFLHIFLVVLWFTMMQSH